MLINEPLQPSRGQRNGEIFLAHHCITHHLPRVSEPASLCQKGILYHITGAGGRYGWIEPGAEFTASVLCDCR